MASKRLAIFTLAMLAGCGGGGSDHAAADSLSRDLQRLPVDSSATFADTATPVAQPVAQPVAVAPKPQPKPKPKPAAPKPAPAPAPAPAPKIVSTGTVLATALDAEISSKVNKAGERVTTTVSSDIKDATGRPRRPGGADRRA
jgi:outer membrane biosynthesis protein TonB